MITFKRILIGLFILGFVGGTVVLGNTYLNFWPELTALISPEQAIEQSKLEQPKIEPSKPEIKPEMVDGSALQDRYAASQQYEPAPEEIAEEQAFESEQIEEAQQWLQDLDSEQRMAGIEQLAAYPSPKAEQLMVERLQKDKSDEIRSAAADNLSYIEVPTSTTQDALIHALQDGNEDVRNSALNTLESYVASLEDDDATAKRIIGLLKSQLKSQQVPADIRESIKEFLTEQVEN